MAAMTAASWGERAVGLLESAKTAGEVPSKLKQLRQLKAVLLHRDPPLLPEFVTRLTELQSERASPVRKFLAERGRSKKRANRENLDAKSFLDLDLVLHSLDNLDPGGNGEAAGGAAKEAVSFIASYATLWLLLHRVLCQRPEASVAFAAFFVEGWRRLWPSASLSHSSSNFADEVTRRM
ncbi:hypothetical protein GW17_00007057 [Ensete ventricosum]|nr:hypothetical protein GW17_00007057 [Ensete ventricosum]RZS25190.1 hypothetical protein BHM03_00058354 [Ensete ventricosum]